MNIIVPAGKTISNILGAQRCSAGAPLRRMNYVRSLSCEDGWLVHNCLTGEMLLLDEHEARCLDTQTAPAGEQASPADPGDTVCYLCEHWFLVPQDYDEYQTVGQMRAIVPTINHLEGVRTFTILPTTGCNARCPYCYEKGIRAVAMTQETAERTAEYIAERSEGHAVKLRWFGGEPLLGLSSIRAICEQLCDKGITFKSRMITNGFLFDEALVREASELWKLKSVQITLDGAQDVYNSVKAYVGEVGNAFAIVLDNIESLARHEIRVEVRLNVSPDNQDDLLRLVDLLAERFSQYKEVSIYTSALYQYTKGSLCTEDSQRAAWGASQRVRDRIDELHMGRAGRYPRLRTSGCIADSDNAVVINPEGGLCQCEHEVMEGLWGTLWEGETDSSQRLKWKQLAAEVPECPTCVHYPSCYRIALCNGGGTCTQALRENYDRRDERTLRMRYHSWKNEEE